MGVLVHSMSRFASILCGKRREGRLSGILRQLLGRGLEEDPVHKRPKPVRSSLDAQLGPVWHMSDFSVIATHAYLDKHVKCATWRSRMRPDPFKSTRQYHSMCTQQAGSLSASVHHGCWHVWAPCTWPYQEFWQGATVPNAGNYMISYTIDLCK